MEINESSIKEEFLRQTMSRWGGDLVRKLQESVDKHKIIDTGKLKRSFFIKIYVGTHGDKFPDATLELGFTSYGRLVDMGLKRARFDSNFVSSRPTQASRGEKLMGEFLGRRQMKRKVKGKGWYTKVVFKNLNDLKYQLANNYDQITKDIIKKQLLLFQKYSD